MNYPQDIIPVFLDRPPYRLEVMATLIGKFAVHTTPYTDTLSTITHIETGRQVFDFVFDKRDEAVQIAEMLAATIDDLTMEGGQAVISPLVRERFRVVQELAGRTCAVTYLVSEGEP